MRYNPRMSEDELHEQFKQRIAQRLKESGKTPRAASLEAGASPDLVRSILSDRVRWPTLPNALGLSKVLDVPLKWLADGSSDDVPAPSDDEDLYQKVAETVAFTLTTVSNPPFNLQLSHDEIAVLARAIARKATGQTAGTREEITAAWQAVQDIVEAKRSADE